MSQKGIFTTNDASKKMAWDVKLFYDSHPARFFHNRMSENQDNIIYLKNEFKKEKGDQIRFTHIQTLDDKNTIKEGQAISGNLQLIGKDYMDIILTSEGTGAEYQGQLSQQRVFFEIDTVTKKVLQAACTSLQDKVIFDKLFAHTFTKQFIGKTIPTLTSATPAGLTVDDKITANKLSFIATGANTGWNYTQEPIEPLMIEGKPLYGALMHDDFDFDLKNDPRYEAWVREAGERGKNNPVFTGASMVINGKVIVFTHSRCPIAKYGAAKLPYGQVLLLGKNALGYAAGPAPKTSMETKEHGRKTEYFWDLMYGCDVLQFKNKSGVVKDRGVVACYFSRTAVSDAE